MQSQVSAQWAADPTKRHELRYWDGAQWTDWVADRGRSTQDPLNPPAPQPEIAQPVGAAAEPPAAGSVSTERGGQADRRNRSSREGRPDIKAVLLALPIVPVREIYGHEGHGTEDITNNDVPVSLAEVVEAFSGFSDDEIVEHGKYVWAQTTYPGGREGVVAIRCGEDEFVFHQWVTLQ